jgi:AAA family ATP:ADP antiporter
MGSMELKLPAPAVNLPPPRDPRTAVRLSALERALRLFTDVRPGEGLTAVIMFADVFLILCAYYFVKPLRDGWIAAAAIKGFSSVEVKAYTSFAQSLVLIAAVAVYARLVTRWPRRELITRTTVFLMSNLVVFWMLRQARIPMAAIIFYIWVGIFGLFVISQFWAFAADLYCDERGKRLMPMIAIGATGGAVAGSFLTGEIVRSGVLDSSALLLVANIPLLAAIGLTAVADARGPTGEGAHPPAQPRAVAAPPGDGRHVGIVTLVSRNRYLLAVAGITLFTHWVSTNGDNLLFRTIQEALAKDLAARGVSDAHAVRIFVREGTTAFYGSFFFWVNVCALVLQAFVASRLLKYGGFGVILLLLPVIALVSQSAMALFPLLLVVQVMKTAESSTSYSINNTAQQVLWLPTTAEMKYKAKPAIETFLVRVGDGLAALTVLVGVRFYALATQYLFLFNAALVVVWLLFGVVVVREHRRLRAGATDASMWLRAAAGRGACAARADRG